MELEEMNGQLNHSGIVEWSIYIKTKSFPEIIVNKY
jgi:hypothetical protein